LKIQVDPNQANPEPELADPTNFRELSVVISGDSADVDVPEVLATLGRLEADDHVFVDQALLIRLAGPLADDPEWRRSFDGMIAYASSHGWVAEDGAVRVHVESPAPSA
jgi:hypothetical protein